MTAASQQDLAREPEPKSAIRARVIANYGADVELLTDSGERLIAAPLKRIGLLVSGDRVTAEVSSHGGSSSARVSELENRKTTLSRTDRNGKIKAVAANLTQLVVVTAPAPPFDPLLLDRYTVAARHIGVDVTILINKTDLLDEQTAVQADAIEALYSSIGYPVLRCCLTTGEGVESLASRLHDHVSILVGQSGVGKSSLLNRLLPDLDVRTGELSKQSGLGKHTTSVTTWFSLPQGGAIIDSAGVRQFSLDHIPSADIQFGFTEISDAAQYCKFTNCTHAHEPDCAVKDALAENRISRQRFENFTLLRESSSEARQY